MCESESPHWLATRRQGAVGYYTFEFNSLPEVSDYHLAAAECDIWFAGGYDSLNATETTTLRTWTFQPGHFLIGGCDAVGRAASCRIIGRDVLPHSHNKCQKLDAKINVRDNANPMACGGQGAAAVRLAGGHSAQLVGITVNGVMDKVLLQVRLLASMSGHVVCNSECFLYCAVRRRA